MQALTIPKECETALPAAILQYGTGTYRVQRAASRRRMRYDRGLEKYGWSGRPLSISQ